MNFNEFKKFGYLEALSSIHTFITNIYYSISFFANIISSAFLFSYNFLFLHIKISQLYLKLIKTKLILLPISQNHPSFTLKRIIHYLHTIILFHSCIKISIKEICNWSTNQLITIGSSKRLIEIIQYYKNYLQIIYKLLPILHPLLSNHHLSISISYPLKVFSQPAR